MPGAGRTDTAARVIAASPKVIYRAFLDPDAWATWLPPRGMTGRVERFEARPGGAYRMALVHGRPAASVRGKTTADTDVVEGRFVDLVPDRRVVHRVSFVSDDPDFAGAMTMTWSLAAAQGGTRVTITCEDVPPGIRADDHDAGLRSTLANLAAFVE